MTNYDEYFAEQMKDEKFRREYEALEPEFTTLQALIDTRTSEELTQPA